MYEHIQIKKKAKMKYKIFLLSHHLNHEQFIQV